MILRTALDYLIQFQRLLPRGRIWHRGLGTLQAQDLLTLMPTPARLDQRAQQLLVDAFPCSTLELLPEWEASLGLPDPCTGPLDSLAARQAAVCAKFSARGGASMAYFIGLAAAMGVTITITQFSPFYAGRNRVGQRLFNTGWAYVWQVTLSGEVVTYFRTGASRVGDRLVTLSDVASILQCVFNAYKPAHTTVIFSYVYEDGKHV
jgi:uncharacterized protein YmfQ (DUF2313 family)